jgi:hypothetical protein
MASHAPGYEDLCFLGCNAMKSGESQSSEESVDFQETTRRYASEDRTFQEIDCLPFSEQVDNYELFSFRSLAWFNPLRVSCVRERSEPYSVTGLSLLLTAPLSTRTIYPLPWFCIAVPRPTLSRRVTLPQKCAR